jgi:ABC-type nitrate/sulfonate/bicarbonate transport system substrate-binding protein
MRKKLIGMAFCAMLLVVNSSAQAAQKEFQKLTVGYTPIGAGSLPLFIAVEERIFQKYGYEVFSVFMGGSPLINSAIIARGISHRLYRRRRGDCQPCERQ